MIYFDVHSLGLTQEDCYNISLHWFLSPHCIFPLQYSNTYISCLIKNVTELYPTNAFTCSLDKLYYKVVY